MNRGLVGRLLQSAGTAMQGRRGYGTRSAAPSRGYDGGYARRGGGGVASPTGLMGIARRFLRR